MSEIESVGGGIQGFRFSDLSEKPGNWALRFGAEATKHSASKQPPGARKSASGQFANATGQRGSFISDALRLIEPQGSLLRL
jgi:hypothetical protein